MKQHDNGGMESGSSKPFRERLAGKIGSDEYFRRVRKDTDKIVRRELSIPRPEPKPR